MDHDDVAPLCCLKFAFLHPSQFLHWHQHLFVTVHLLCNLKDLVHEGLHGISNVLSYFYKGLVIGVYFLSGTRLVLMYNLCVQPFDLLFLQ